MQNSSDISGDLYADISQLLAQYCWAIDENQAHEWADLYTPDGVFEGTRPEPIVGYEALLAVPADVYERFGGKVRHQIGNLWIKRDGEDRLTARFYNQISIWNGAETKLFMMALSSATLVRDGGRGRWRIARNSITPLL